MSNPASAIHPARSYGWLAMLVMGYVGVYLCRKNLPVAIPMIQESFGVTRSQIGEVASWSTIAYAGGKFIFGPIIDRFGGRACFLVSLFSVALFGLAGAASTSLAMMTVLYSSNRLGGSMSWGSMVKLVPDWFAARQMPLAMAILSMGFVFGGVCATLFAGQVAEWSHNNWRMVMGMPSLILIILLIGSAVVLPRRGPTNDPSDHNDSKPLPGSRFSLAQFADLLRVRQFWVVLGLSFTLTLMRETFNTWTVDFFKTEGGPDVSNRVAAFLSTPFDAFGAVGIIALGWVFGRIGRAARTRLLFLMLIALSLLIYNLPALYHRSLWSVTAALGLIGFLAYGPYSLLAGIFAVEIRGPLYVATVAGLVDGTGYLAGILAGKQFGHLVDIGGYRLGFQALSVLTIVAAVLCLFLYSGSAAEQTGPVESNPRPSPGNLRNP